MKVVFLRANYQPCPDDEAPARFGFECPRRQGYICQGLLIAGAKLADGTVIKHNPDTKKPPCWDWNGSRTAPTFKPSINCLAHDPKNPAEKYTGCGWHGHITDGKHTGT